MRTIAVSYDGHTAVKGPYECKRNDMANKVRHSVHVRRDRNDDAS